MVKFDIPDITTAPTAKQVESSTVTPSESLGCTAKRNAHKVALALNSSLNQGWRNYQLFFVNPKVGSKHPGIKGMLP